MSGSTTDSDGVTRSAFGSDAGWGEGDELTAFEAMMWRAEADPRLRSDGVFLDLLDATPDFERLRAAHEWATRRVPRLGQRIVDDPLHLGPPAWVGAHVDVDEHLTRTVLPDGATFDDALEVTARFLDEPFDLERPLWRAMLVEGLPDGQSAYLLKLHHVLADGTAFVQLFDMLHSDRREPTPVKPIADEPSPPSVSGTGLVARHAADLLRGAPGALAGAARRVARAAADPSGTLAYASSLGRVTASTPGTPSPLLRERGAARRVVAIDVPGADLRAAGKAAGGSLNDAFLAGLAAALRRYHAEHGTPVDEIPMALPVSLRSADDAHGGNKFAGARIALPVGTEDVTAIIARVRAQVRTARDEPALDFLGAGAPLVSRIPTAALTRMTANFTTSLDLQASNFRGLERPAYIAGARVLRMFPFGPTPGCAMMATLVSHEGCCCIGITVDTAAVPDVEVFGRCVREGFDDVLALAAS